MRSGNTAVQDEKSPQMGPNERNEKATHWLHGENEVGFH